MEVRAARARTLSYNKYYCHFHQSIVLVLWQLLSPRIGHTREYLTSGYKDFLSLELLTQYDFIGRMIYQTAKK